MRETPWPAHPELKQGEEGMVHALPEIRCRRCRRLLMKGEIKRVEIKCPKCGYVQTEAARPELPQG